MGNFSHFNHEFSILDYLIQDLKKDEKDQKKLDENVEYVAKYKIDEWVDGCLGYTPGFAKEEQIQSILEQHELEPEEAIFVGDSLTDGDYAKDRRVRFIGIRRIFDERAFQERGLPSVQDLTALTRLWRQSEDLLQLVEKVQ